MCDLNTGKGLDVYIRALLLYSSHHVNVVLVGQVRVEPSNYVHLCNRLIHSLPYLCTYLVKRHLVGLVITLLLAECAEFAQIGAHVRVVYVLVINVIGRVAVLALTYNVGHETKKREVRGLKELYAVCCC